MSTKQKKATAVLVWMILIPLAFSVVFFLIGAFALGKGISGSSKGTGFTEKLAGLLGLGSLLLLFSSFVLIAVLYTRKYLKKENQRKEEFPNEP